MTNNDLIRENRRLQEKYDLGWEAIEVLFRENEQLKVKIKDYEQTISNLKIEIESLEKSNLNRAFKGVNKYIE